MGTKEAQQRFVRRREATAGFSPLITASPKTFAHEKKYSRKGSKVILIFSGLLVPPFSSAKSGGKERDLANNLCIIAEKKPFCAKRVLGWCWWWWWWGIFGRSIKKGVLKFLLSFMAEGENKG